LTVVTGHLLGVIVCREALEGFIDLKWQEVERYVSLLHCPLRDHEVISKSDY
jgi:hypothetical protein